MVETTGATRRAKLQSNHHHQQTNTQARQDIPTDTDTAAAAAAAVCRFCGKQMPTRLNSFRKRQF